MVQQDKVFEAKLEKIFSAGKIRKKQNGRKLGDEGNPNYSR